MTGILLHTLCCAVNRFLHRTWKTCKRPLRCFGDQITLGRVAGCFDCFLPCRSITLTRHTSLDSPPMSTVIFRSASNLSREPKHRFFVKELFVRCHVIATWLQCRAALCDAPGRTGSFAATFVPLRVKAMRRPRARQPISFSLQLT